MTDIVSVKKRSEMMSGIRAANTKPELAVRSILHKMGLRFRLHDKKLPGKPDLVFPKYQAVIMIHGCFWHGHDCHLFKMPSSNTFFWQTKISTNKQRDKSNVASLNAMGWRVLIVWECALKGKKRIPVTEFAQYSYQWVVSGGADIEIRCL
ncbi:very short patch repair endonuclease [Chitinophaga sp. XS-30]|uniref:very short patch repair endonuclease n=1 Tax=Chitinophaga sp. XS-30 TaxID=2604421 RepID=UPI0011DC73EE|nr:very short patch repair endonuclease [Chitinophaga sp. XS-30]QEH39953.1 DNA mismatch endonuclease Vsr [Chitinophaga sp. XS-30]